jgi:hypothetical protein
MDNKKDMIMLGGFFYENIRNWVIAECIESGDPESFFSNLYSIVYDLQDEVENNKPFWYGY